VRSLERTLLDIKDSRTSSTFRRDADEAASVLLAAGGPVEMEYHALTV